MHDSNYINMETSVIFSITAMMILMFSSLLGTAQSRILLPRNVLSVVSVVSLPKPENEVMMVINRPALSPPPSPKPSPSTRQAMNPFSWALPLSAATDFYKFMAFVFHNTVNVVLPKSSPRNLFAAADDNGCCGRDPPKPPSPDPNPSQRQSDGDRYVAAMG